MRGVIIDIRANDGSEVYIGRKESGAEGFLPVNQRCFQQQATVMGLVAVGVLAANS